MYSSKSVATNACLPQRLCDTQFGAGTLLSVQLHAVLKRNPNEIKLHGCSEITVVLLHACSVRV